MKTVSIRLILDERLGAPEISVVDELEPLFQEAVHDSDVRAALLRGELPSVVDEVRHETRRLLLSLLPASIEEIAERIVEYDQAAA